MKAGQIATLSPQQWQTHCNTSHQCQSMWPQQRQHMRAPASVSLVHQSSTPTAVRRSTARRRGGARSALHSAGHASHSNSSVSRDLLDCWPGCSRASWIEGGPELGVNGNGFGSNSGVALSAAALAEPPAEPEAAEPPDADATANSVTRIMSPEEFEQQLASHGLDLVVLMCKAHSCRPCKMFGRKYQRLAESYPDATFLEIFGDDTKETRKLMISMSIRVTPNFRLYRNGELVEQLSGINETNLRNAVERALNPDQAEAAEAGA